MEVANANFRLLYYTYNIERVTNCFYNLKCKQFYSNFNQQSSFDNCFLHFIHNYCCREMYDGWNLCNILLPKPVLREEIKSTVHYCKRVTNCREHGRKSWEGVEILICILTWVMRGRVNPTEVRGDKYLLAQLPASPFKELPFWSRVYF